jgi:DNA-binding beta-propeller fold protein YncE
VAADASGNIYVVDSNHHRIQVFTSSGIYVSEWGSFGSGNGQLNLPVFVTVDAAGNAFVSDRGNNRIQKFASNASCESIKISML